MKLFHHDWQAASNQPATAPAGDEVHVWLATLPAANDWQSENFVHALSADEQERLRRGRDVAANGRFLLGRLMARSLLGAWLGLAPERVELVFSPLGKPRLKYPGDLCFNLSSSRSLVAMAVAVRGNVGIDVEWIDGCELSEALMQRVLSPHELQAFATLPNPQQHHAWYQTWTRKEAWLKATGSGLTVDPATLDWPPPAEWHDLTVPPGYAGTVVRLGC